MHVAREKTRSCKTVCMYLCIYCFALSQLTDTRKHALNLHICDMLLRKLFPIIACIWYIPAQMAARKKNKHQVGHAEHRGMGEQEDERRRRQGKNRPRTMCSICKHVCIVDAIRTAISSPSCSTIAFASNAANVVIEYFIRRK